MRPIYRGASLARGSISWSGCSLTLSSIAVAMHAFVWCSSAIVTSDSKNLAVPGSRSRHLVAVI